METDYGIFEECKVLTKYGYVFNVINSYYEIEFKSRS